MIVVVGLFLFLGGLLYLYAANLGGHFEGGKYIVNGVDATGDKLFPFIALYHMTPIIAIIFIIALISALFPSADGAITALTSSFCIDIIGLQRREDLDDKQKKALRQRVHLVFAAIFLLIVMIYKWISDPSMIGLILKVAAYTYGPLLGLFSFGILTKRTVNDKLVPLVCVAAPLLCYLMEAFQKQLFGSFEIGLELLIINGGLTFLGLWAISKKPAPTN
jgi:Na+/proline symporter